MSSSLSKSVDDYLKEFKAHIISSIDKSEWSEYNFLLDNLLSALGKIVDESVNPNRSGIVQSTYRVLFDIAIKLLQSNEYERLLDIIERAFSRYRGRKKDNEPSDPVSAFFGDLVVWKYSQVLYNEIEKIKINELPFVMQTKAQLEFLIEQHFLFLRLGNIKVFDISISFYFSCILDNVKLTAQENEFALTSCLRELYRITQHDLGELRRFEDERDKTEVLKYYILEWSAILRYLYQKDMHSAVGMIFSYNGSNVIGIDQVINQFFPQIAHVFIMMVVMDGDHDISYKMKYAEVQISQQFESSISITEYILSLRYKYSYDILKESYIAFTILAEKWKTRYNTLTTFDHSPENFLILFCTFFVGPEVYSEMISWAMELERFDRFSEMIDDVKSAIQVYPNDLENPVMSLRLKVFIAMFLNERYVVENHENNVHNVSLFQDIANKILSTWIIYNQLGSNNTLPPYKGLALYAKSWYYARIDNKNKMIDTLRTAISIDSKFKDIFLMDNNYKTYLSEEECRGFINPLGIQT